MKQMIQVTQEDIDKGARLACTRCPVALSVERALGFKARVTKTYIECRLLGGSVVTPGVVSRFIGNYDNGDTVAPFEFELDVPEE